jgi:hypothetical protein
VRNVTDVLKQDGVRFDANGAADPSQRITAAELAPLIEVLDYDTLEASDGRQGNARAAASTGRLPS